MTAESLITSISHLYIECLQKALDESAKQIRTDRCDLETLVKNAQWEAYCEAFEQSIRIVKECTEAGLNQLKKMDRQFDNPAVRSVQDPIETEGPDMNASYPKD